MIKNVEDPTKGFGVVVKSFRTTVFDDIWEVKNTEDLSTNNTGHQWTFGSADASGYYNIMTPNSTHFLTAESPDKIRLQGIPLYDFLYMLFFLYLHIFLIF